MKKIFLDANIIIDFLDSSSRDHSTAVKCLYIIRKHFGKPLVSPLTFIIVNFVLSKFVKDKNEHKKRMELVFSGFEITAVQPGFIEAVFKTFFTDLEDGLQYQCALHSKATIIITKDISDYFDSKIPVIHPYDFSLRYDNLPGR